jgi:hypothetical protein
MTVTLILVLCAAFALVFFLFRMKGYGTALVDEATLASRLQSVDLDAFRNLIDPDEEEFLRSNLPPAEFRPIRRQRLRAAVDYVAGVSQNAAVLLQLGLAARLSADPRVADAGRQLVDDAVRLRLYSLVAVAKLYTRIVVPGNVLEPAGLVDGYQSMSHRAALLGRLQNPAQGGLLTRAL